MQISDTARDILVAYVRSRLDGGKPVLSYAELAELVGRPGGASAISKALDAVGEWCAANSLPNIATAIISSENAERNVMLPSDAAVENLGGAAAVRAEQARVRDFDWSHWIKS